jgi:anti-sigma B factor antagonist
MSIIVNNDPDSATSLRIDGALTIYEAAAAASELLPLVQKPAALCIDLSGITEIDCAGLQLLLAVQKENALTIFTAPSHSVASVLQLTGLERALSLEPA